MDKKDFDIFAKRNIKRYVINKLCGVYRIIKKEPPKLLYYYNLFFVLINFHFFKKLYIPQVEFIITTKCTLKCKHCSNYIPYIEENQQFNLNIFEFLFYINNLLKNVHKLNSLILLGGEPLLNPDIDKILEYSLKNKKIEKVYIFTNGTILFNYRLLEILKKYKKKSHIFVSNYTNNKEIQNILKTDKVLAQLKSNNIQYTFHKTEAWVKQEPICPYNRTDLENSNMFRKCPVPSIASALGEVHICPKAASARIRELISFDKSQFLDLKKVVEKEEILSFYSRDNFVICNNCSGPDAPVYLIKPAEQIKKENNDV